MTPKMQFALDLAKRNDGYLMEALDNPTLDALRDAKLIYTRPAGDGYVIARAIVVSPIRYYGGFCRNIVRPVDVVTI